ncbi:zinc metalloprotease HtpX [Nanoarchaeota archaeon]
MKNQIKTVVLLTLLAVLLMFIGRLLGGTSGLIIGLVFALGINFVSYWWSDKIVLKIYKAKEANLSEHQDLHQIVESLSVRAKIPKPKVYVIPSQHPNAFACGRSPKHSAVAFTEGILGLLNNYELKSVAAHELSHIKNRDTLISTVSATIAAVISFVAMMARWAAIFGGVGGDRDNGGILEFLILAIVAPIAAMIIRLAISRSREYLADESGAKLLHDGSGLASALEKLQTGIKHAPLKPMGTTESTAHLFIENPFRGKGLFTIFSTHPPTTERTKRLRSMRF